MGRSVSKHMCDVATLLITSMELGHVANRTSRLLDALTRSQPAIREFEETLLSLISRGCIRKLQLIMRAADSTPSARQDLPEFLRATFKHLEEAGKLIVI